MTETETNQRLAAAGEAMRAAGYTYFTLDRSDLVGYWDERLRDALNAIEQRNGPKAAGLYAEILRRLEDDTAVLFVAQAGQETVAVLVTMIVVDGVGDRICQLWAGWMDAHQHGRVFDVGLMVIETLAEAAGCVALESVTCRDPKAYGEWIGRRGFKYHSTKYRKPLAAPAGASHV